LSANEKRLRSKRGTKRAEESGEGKKLQEIVECLVEMVKKRRKKVSVQQTKIIINEHKQSNH
jgi:molybdopterin converting factor small subunit